MPVRAGDHNAAVLSDARVFAGAEEGVEDVKRQIALESGLADLDAAQEPEPEPEAEEDDGGITVDEDGVEWYEDEEGSGGTDPGEPDWVLYEEDLVDRAPNRLAHRCKWLCRTPVASLGRPTPSGAGPLQPG